MILRLAGGKSLWEDRPAITKALASGGIAYLNSLLAKISDATTRSSDMTAQQLEAQGVIARGTDPSVVISKSAKLAFYTTGESFAGRTLGDIDPYCQTLKVGGYSNWHWPTRQELGAVVSSTGVLIDTPDRRYWRVLTTVTTQLQYLIPKTPSWITAALLSV